MLVTSCAEGAIWMHFDALKIVLMWDRHVNQSVINDLSSDSIRGDNGELSHSADSEVGTITDIFSRCIGFSRTSLSLAQSDMTLHHSTGQAGFADQCMLI